MGTVDCVILGSGNIGTDLMLKIHRRSRLLRVVAVAGIDPASKGLALASQHGIATTDAGLEGLRTMPQFARAPLVFDATSASAHSGHAAALKEYSDKTLIDLTPAAIGEYVVPVVNLDQHLHAPVLNLVSCGGQATIPIVAAIQGCVPVHYAEIVASIASRSAGPGTRANIDEFTATTARGLERVGGARRGRAIIVLNPAEPPVMMRNTVYTLTASADRAQIAAAIDEMVSRVQAYVPGYRLKQQVVFEDIGPGKPLHIPGEGEFHGLKTSVFLEVRGAGDFLPAYAGNLDIMTSAAMGAGEQLARTRYAEHSA